VAHFQRMVQVGYSCQSIWHDLLLQKLHEIGQTVTPESRFQILVNFIYYESCLVHMNWWYTFKFAWCKAPARSQNAELSVCDLRKKPIFFYLLVNEDILPNIFLGIWKSLTRRNCPAKNDRSFWVQRRETLQRLVQLSASIVDILLL